MHKFLPPAASQHAASIDAMLEHVHWIVLVLFAGWAVYFLWVMIRYRAGRQPEPNLRGARGHLAMVVFAGVVVAEGVMLIGVALPGWYERMVTRPTGGKPLVMRVVAQQFQWNVHFAGADGLFGETAMSFLSPTNPLGLNRESPAGRDDLTFVSEIHLPVGRPVVVELTSKDVIHSFGVPAMRVKQDAIPGTRAVVWFTPTVEGEFEIVCSQLCGLAHHRMRGVIKVESEEAFQRFLAEEAKLQIVK
jgi:cytochrome c oxidase subunit II